MRSFCSAIQITLLVVLSLGTPQGYAAPQPTTPIAATLIVPLKGKFVCVSDSGGMVLAEYMGAGSVEEAIAENPTIPVKLALPLSKLIKKQQKAKKRYAATGDRNFRVKARAFKKLIKLQSQCADMEDFPLPPSGEPPISAPPTDTPDPDPDSPELPQCEVPWAFLPSGPCVTPENCSVKEEEVDPATLQEVGPFDTYPDGSRINGLAFYIYSQGAGELVSLNVTRSQSWNDHRAVLRVFDPDERVVYWQLQTQSKNQSGLPVPSVAIVESPTEPIVPTVFRLMKPGIYEVRLATNSNAKLSMKLSPDTVWGFSQQNAQFRKSNFGNPATSLYAWIRSHPTMPNRLAISQPHADLKVFRESDGVELSNALPIIPAGLPGGGEIWRFQLPPGNVTYFQSASGVPLIFAPTKEAAQMLSAAHLQIDQGPLTGYRVAHRFQLELARLVPKILDEVSKAALSFSDLQFATMQNPLCKSPVLDDDVYRFQSLLGFGYHSGTLTSAAWSLNTTGGIPNQQLDPDEPWLGAIGLSRVGSQACSVDADCLNGSSCNSGFCSVAFDVNTMRWDIERELAFADLATSDSDDTIRFRSGISPENQAVSGMAFAAITDTPCNLLRPELIGEDATEALIARATLSFVIDLLRITESEIALGDGTASATYPTHHLFTLQQVLFPKLLLVTKAIPHAFSDSECGGSLSELINATIFAGIRRVIDRQLGDYLVSVGNQHAHAVLIFKEFADAIATLPTHDLYQGLSDTAAHDFAALQQPEGYWAEADGPDASYIGMTHNLIGQFYRLAKVSGGELPAIFSAALNASYELFNHTVAPEKNGKLQGGFNFNHRIATGFNREQYSGGKGIVEDVPQAGMWGNVTYNYTAQARTDLADRVNQFQSHASNILASSGGIPLRFYYFDSSQRDPNAVFPYQEESFSRQIGDEFIVIKKPKYMTSIYVGRPASSVDGEKRDWAHGVHPEFEDIDPQTDPLHEASISVYQNTPLTGGGMSMFWTPEFGNSVLGASWSPLVHHGLLVVLGGQRYWEHYNSTSFIFQPASNVLSVSGSLENAGVYYTREYNFGEDKVDISVNLFSLATMNSQGLFENIPLMTCTRSNCNPNSGVKNRKSMGSKIVDLSGNPLNGQYTLAGFRVVDDEGDGVEVLFDGMQTIKVYPHGMREVYYNDELQLGRVQIVLPSVLTDGENLSFQYSIGPIAP